MLKALIKKELAMLLTVYTFDSRKGRPRSTGAAIVFALLFLFIFALIFMLFYSLAQGLSAPLTEQGLEWLYFSLMGLLTIMVGVIGSVFTTYSILYKAKDNELLLSMPIPPAYILFARMLTVFIMNIVCCALVWVPAIVVHGSTGLPLVFQILLLFILTLLVTVLTCFLGWVIALVAGRLNNKTFATVAVSLILVGGYYYFYFKIDRMIKYVIANGAEVASSIKGWGFPAWQLGLASTGSVLSLIGFSLAVIALFILTYAILSKTLIGLLTAKRAGKKAVYREKREKLSGADSALLRKELKRFVSSSTYLLNSGFGMLMMAAAAAALLIKADTVYAAAEKVLGAMGNLGIIPVAAAAAVCLITSADNISAPSVSLEGRQIWILQTMPVDAARVLKAKKRLHVLLNGVPAILLTAALGFVLRAKIYEILLMLCVVGAFIWLHGAFGLMMNLLKPNLEWTSEAVPIKQGMPVMFSMFGGWVVAGAILVTGLLLSSFMQPWMLLAVHAVILTVLALLVEGWLSKKGSEIFSHITV